MNDVMTKQRRQIELGQCMVQAATDFNDISVVRGGAYLIDVVNFWRNYSNGGVEIDFAHELSQFLSPYDHDRESYVVLQVYFKHLLLMANSWQQALEVMNVIIDFVRAYDDRRNTGVDFGQPGLFKFDKEKALIALFAGMIESATYIVSNNVIDGVEEAVLVINKLIVFVVGRCERVEIKFEDEKSGLVKVTDRLLKTIKMFYRVIFHYCGDDNANGLKYFVRLLEDLRALQINIKLKNDQSIGAGHGFSGRKVGFVGIEILKNLFFMWAERQGGLELFDLIKV
ncbi:hypothetical protein COT97_02655 [Candidatus Falkowbacteria bacterium CG10_big_fil_rev_8_21_14_0_10_39_11]|uniref:Uncharacterized protein n=1 Tax=Candidatus Falkowbacteria bacterium CG10_big_fil_rev_8_21_14_0_10_39_11 TaxID=1974565 RepID=A0A2H0V545_9BACT|nr:MAG: hypothetical protein COT97_02655 [Candidatus Falkowbacteria bacterium CG10_big_fil_rev_8_21_14_0_10_39_11]